MGTKLSTKICLTIMTTVLVACGGESQIINDPGASSGSSSSSSSSSGSSSSSSSSSSASSSSSNSSSSSSSGQPTVSNTIPGVILPESFADFMDSSDESNGNCREDIGLDLEIRTPGQPCNIGWTEAGEWVRYQLSSDVSGDLDFEVSVSSLNPGKEVAFFLDDKNIGSVTTAGNGWDGKEKHVLRKIAVSKGEAMLEVAFVSGSTNFFGVTVKPHNPVVIDPVGDLQLTRLDEAKLSKVKQAIKEGNSYFQAPYDKLIENANAELQKVPNPVTNKTIAPPSGNKKDYYTIAPYWWPDPNKKDGLPWIRKDGQVNPDTRNDNTDIRRLQAFFGGLETLTYAYYFSGQKKYADKALANLKVWLVDPKTSVNPNIKYGQGVPGSVSGRAAGIIEWSGLGSVVTAAEILKSNGILVGSDLQTVNKWMADMLHWYQTHEYALKEFRSTNNHGNWYDVQVLSMMGFLGKKDDMTAYVEGAKKRRIAEQIEPDGSQPAELGRTKSVNYSTMNLRAMVNIAVIGRKVGVDLWQYKTSDGRSISKAFDFLRPYVLEEKTWRWDQITGGGAAQSLQDLTLPLFAECSSMLGVKLLGDADLKRAANGYNDMEKLIYPPLHIIP